MADAVRHTGLCSQDNPVESLGNGLCDAHPSSIGQEVDGPGATRIPVLHVDNQLLLTAGTLSQMDEAVKNNSQGAAEQTSNPSISNGTAIDASNLLLHPAHNTVQLGGMDDLNNGQLGFFGNGGNLLSPSASLLPTAQAGGAGNDDDEDEELNPPLEEEVEELESGRLFRIFGRRIAESSARVQKGISRCLASEKRIRRQSG